MPREPDRPQPQLMKALAQFRTPVDLRRVGQLPSAAALLTGYPDWIADSNQVRVIDQASHCSVTVANHEVTYVQDSGDVELELARLEGLTTEFFDHLNVSRFTRLGYRKYFLIPLNMTFPEAVQAFHLRYYVNDPLAMVGHSVEDVLYRVDSVDSDGWKWHVTYAPVPAVQIPSLLQYRFNEHWPASRSSNSEAAFVANLPQVALFADFDCYRDSSPLAIDEWRDFLVAARDKTDRAVEGILDSFFGEI